MHLSKILCPLDFSAASKPLVAYAAALAKATGAELCLLHVREAQPVLSESKDATDDVVVAVALAQYKAAAGQAGAPRVRTAVCHGDAARQIVAEAERSHTDLILIGSHGRTGLTRFLMGNTAEHVVRTASCATLLVKPQGKNCYRQSA